MTPIPVLFLVTMVSVTSLMTSPMLRLMPPHVVSMMAVFSLVMPSSFLPLAVCPVAVIPVAINPVVTVISVVPLPLFRRNLPLPLVVLGDRLGEIHMNPPVVYQHVVHLEVGLLTLLRLVELDEGVLKRSFRPTIAYHFAANDLAKSRENHLEVL
jgi:hypothetical protein